MSRFSQLRRWAAPVALSVSIGLIAIPTVTATVASAKSANDIIFKASGDYLKKRGETSSAFKISLTIPQTKKKPPGADLGKASVTEVISLMNIKLSAKYEKENNARLRVTLSETPHRTTTLVSGGSFIRSTVDPYAVRLGKTWRYLEWNDPKLVYNSVPGKAFYVQGKFKYKEERYIYGGGRWQWELVEEGYFTTKKIQTTAVTKVKK